MLRILSTIIWAGLTVHSIDRAIMTDNRLLFIAAGCYLAAGMLFSQLRDS